MTLLKTIRSIILGENSAIKMAESLKSNQAVWRNTIKAFHNQATQMEKMVATARQCVNDFEDPDKENVTIRDVKRLVDPIGRKLELTSNYVTSLTALLPAAAGEETDSMNMDNLSAELGACMEQVEHANVECANFYEYIEDAQVSIKKEKKTDKTRPPPGGKNLMRSKVSHPPSNQRS